MAKRYEQLIALAAELNPSVIVEVGVHGAIRGARMVEAGQGTSLYIGYDVFETRDKDFQRSALNGKGVATEAVARQRLETVRRRRHGFAYRLVVGDTRETLHGTSVEADLVFIDGDHRVEAIEGDYRALMKSKVVVFDDYYRRDHSGRLPDLGRYGANRVVDGLAAEGRRVEILPIADPTRDGGLSHLAVVR